MMGDCCASQAFFRVVLRATVEDLLPTTLDFCGHHWKQHQEKVRAYPGFVEALLIDASGMPVKQGAL